MILNGMIIETDTRRTAYPKRQEYWRLVVYPYVRGKLSKDVKYVNFHEPKARHINVKDFHPHDFVTIKCYERKGSSGKTFIHGIKIMKRKKYDRTYF